MVPIKSQNEKWTTRLVNRKRTSLCIFLATLIGALAWTFVGHTSPPSTHNVIIRNGTVYDGTGGPPRRADVGIQGDQIVAIGDPSKAKAATEIDAKGLAVAPGFINMLSHSEISLIADDRSLSELRQGVTTQIFGESSMGPLTDVMKKNRLTMQGDIKYDIPWTTLADYMTYLEQRGISQNIASFIGAGTIREYVIGLEDKPPTPPQLEQMQALVRREMEAGALGITTALIYAPNFFAKTDELIALCKVASKYRGKYIAHIRSEGNQLLEAVEELIRIARAANIPAEIYHLKASGEANWTKMDAVIKRINDARRQGLKITADMYTYTAGATGLTSTMPPWVLDGGYEALYRRLQDAETRKKIAAAMRKPAHDWENMFLLPGSLELERRGLLKQGYFADIVIFDPQTIADQATYENPHQYAVGVKHVFVNGIQALKDGEHTHAKPGRAPYGSGKVK